MNEPAFPSNGYVASSLDYLRTNPCRLDPTHIWDWPIESREGMPCWARDHNTWHKGFVLSDGCVLCGDAVLNIVNPEEEGDFVDVVAPNPLNPTMEPPAGWSPEGKRILK